MCPDSPEDTSGPGMEMDDVATPVDALLQQGRRTFLDRIMTCYLMLSLINLIDQNEPCFEGSSVNGTTGEAGRQRW